MAYKNEIQIANEEKRMDETMVLLPRRDSEVEQMWLELKSNKKMDTKEQIQTQLTQVNRLKRRWRKWTDSNVADAYERRETWWQLQIQTLTHMNEKLALELEHEKRAGKRSRHFRLSFGPESARELDIEGARELEKAYEHLDMFRGAYEMIDINDKSSWATMESLNTARGVYTNTCII